MSSSSTWSRPAVSTITVFRPSRSASTTPGARDRDRVGRLGEDRHADAVAEHRELVDGGRALEVGGDEEHALALLVLEQPSELRGGGRLARALEPGEHDHGRRLRRDVRSFAARAAERRDELFVDDLDDLLTRAEALGDLGAGRALLQASDEALDDADVHVGLEQREPDLASHLVDVGRRELPPAPAAGGRCRRSDRTARRTSGVDLVALVEITLIEIRVVARFSVGPTSAAANSAGSNGTRSAADSPTPTSFTGTPSSDSIASTTPPFAVPSSLVRTTPVTPTASRELSRLREPVLTGGRVEHEEHLAQRRRACARRRAAPSPAPP